MSEAISKPSTTPQIGVAFSDITKNVLYISRGVELNQPRLIQRAVRQNASVRKYVTAEQLQILLKKYIPATCTTLQAMLELVEKLPKKVSTSEDSVEEKEAMEIDKDLTSAPLPSSVEMLEEPVDAQAFVAPHAVASVLPEVEVFNRRSLDILSAKAYFYLSLSFERVGKTEQIRPLLLTLYRTCCVRRDEMGQAVLLNLLLANYLNFNLFDQAHTLSLRASFPESASNNQFCRYLYYMGRIQATQLEYSEKLIVIVQLLMGEIPERSLFNQKELRQALLPYLALTQAVRTGDLKEFADVIEKYKDAFSADKNFTLVLKIGLRKISISYSRISLLDVAQKLHIQSAEAAEYICAKAIRDGVIEAKIDHEQGWLFSHEVMDLYSTDEPRIAFCLDVHNEAVKSMRYPPDDTYKKSKDADGKKDSKQEEKTIDELIKEFEEEMDE
eukprot:gene25529-34086_t